MNSKEFNDLYLKNEYDEDILNAQYVLVSTRILLRNGDTENIVSAMSILFPNSSACSTLNDEDFKKVYMNQLSGALPFLATLIKGSIEEGYNIIFLCTNKEDKLHYLYYLSLFIAHEFHGFPVYNYTSFVAGCKLIKYNEDKVLHKCNKILLEAHDNEFEKKRKTYRGREELLRRYKKMSKAELKKLVKDEGLYKKGMSKSELIDILEMLL